jgi:hypothetical protein
VSQGQTHCHCQHHPHPAAHPDQARLLHPAQLPALQLHALTLVVAVVVLVLLLLLLLAAAE